MTSKTFFSLNPSSDASLDNRRDPSRKWIAIQLGAAQPEKTWNPESWANVAAYVLRRHPEYRFVLLGGKDDQPRVKRFLSTLESQGQDSKNILSMVGQTDFDIWASVISSSQWLFSGDTAAIHLASVLGTRILNVSVGPVRWAETGPYGNGHYIVSSNKACASCTKRDPYANHTCRNDVTAESVYATWSYASNEWAHRRQLSLESHFSRLGWSDQLQSVRINRSKIRSTNDGGGVFYEPLIQRSLDISDWSAMVMDHIARAWYCGWSPPVGHELTREMVGPALIQQLRALDESTAVLVKICTEASRIATSLYNKSASMKSDRVMSLQDRTELQRLGANLIELDELVNRLGKTHAPLQAFAHMLKVLMHNLNGDHLADLGLESANSYKQIKDGVEVLREWTKFTLNLAKPVAIKSQTQIASVTEINQ